MAKGPRVKATVRDSRRVPGINLLFDGAGAVLDVGFADAAGDALIAAWERELSRMLAAVGWGGAPARVRRFPGGASLFVAAPPDALYAATEVNEHAWASAVAQADGGADPDFDAAADRLRALIADERHPGLLALREVARRRGVSFHADHRGVSVGSGAGARVWPSPHPRRPEVPAAPAVPWAEVRDVPQILVTGTNGKTTTVRLLASIVRAWGRTPGLCSTDHIVIGDEVVDEGDWSGPMGARAVLRDPRVDVAILETARGGILRRGLAVERADAAIVTNVAEDHVGEWGIADLRGIAEAKLVAGRVARRLVLNAEDPMLMDTATREAARGRLRGDIGCFALDPGNPVLRAHLDKGGTGATLDRGWLVFARGARWTPVVPADAIPIALGGVALHNVANALGALLVAAAVGIPREAIARGLSAFRGTPKENPGRSHLFDFGGARVLVDFAHNPHGMRALIATAQAMHGTRRLVVLGQSGDRDDEAIRGLARETWSWHPDLVVLKEMPRYLRGRRPGEATGLIRDELMRLGADPAAFVNADSELAAVRLALGWARPGDLILLPTHAEREAVLALMEHLEVSGWRPGRPLP